MERIALIAHDRKKDDLVDFAKNHKDFLHVTTWLPQELPVEELYKLQT